MFFNFLLRKTGHGSPVGHIYLWTATPQTLSESKKKTRFSDIYIVKAKERSDPKTGQYFMKVYKIYSITCDTPHPIEDVTQNEEMILSDAIDYQWNEFCYHEGKGGMLGMIAKAREAYKTIDWDGGESFKNAYEFCTNLLKDIYEKQGHLVAGDWSIVKIDDEDDPWRHRSNAWISENL